MSSNPFDLESLFHGFTSKVTLDMNSRLTKEFSAEEIKNAVFSIKGGSTPGEDGMSGVFYQNYRHIVGNKVIEDVRRFFETSTMPAGWNHTQLCLIPKIPNPDSVKDMRPIALCSVQYKIISKLLSDRLKVILPSLISDTQGAFVSGKLITDNIIVAHELVHGLRTNPSLSSQFMAIKTDMSKAFDRVEWSFLETLLERFGFDRVWVRWVMTCVNSVSYTVLLNGRVHGFICLERGIRQGDPISPSLFILCAEALVNVLNQSELSGRLHGIQLDAQGPSVHHLLFVDDNLLMCKADILESAEISRCLSLYGDASGQQINKLKSSIIFGDRVDPDVKEEVKRVLEIDKEGGEGTYLGLPEVFKGSNINILNFIREKLQHRLHGWFAKSLSQGGKEILLKSIGLALLVYEMSVFKLPKDLCGKFTSAMREFWWSSGGNSRKLPWVAWDKLCKSKEEGGLGFHDLALFNQALLGKQAWRIFSQPESLVARILKSPYFKISSFLDASIGVRPSYTWRSILHGREVLKQGLMRKVGDGASSNVWMSNWIIDTVVRPPMYRQDSTVDLTLTISGLMIPQTGQWDIVKLRNCFTAEDVDRIIQIRPKITSQDSDTWGFTHHGVYTTQSAYKLLNSIKTSNSSDRSLPPIEKLLWKHLWKLKTSSKLCQFLWRALSGALEVGERLRSRGINVNPSCKSCGYANEDICHVLFLCAASEAWIKPHHLASHPAQFFSTSTS